MIREKKKKQEFSSPDSNTERAGCFSLRRLHGILDSESTECTTVEIVCGAGKLWKLQKFSIWMLPVTLIFSFFFTYGRVFPTWVLLSSWIIYSLLWRVVQHTKKDVHSAESLVPAQLHANSNTPQPKTVTTNCVQVLPDVPREWQSAPVWEP